MKQREIYDSKTGHHAHPNPLRDGVVEKTSAGG
jgi:hypothetical protein